MLDYILKRLLALIPLLAGATFIVFVFFNLSMIYHAAFRLGFMPEIHLSWLEYQGLNDPLLVQYIRYIARVFRGDFGTSGGFVVEPIRGYLPYTLRLGFVALSAALLLAVPVGAIAVAKRDTWVDRVGMFIDIIGISMSILWSGVFLVIFLSLLLGRFNLVRIVQLNSFVLPGMALGYAILSAMMLSARSSVLEAVRRDYIRAAQAKSLLDSKTIQKYAPHNIIIHILVILKAHLGAFFAGIIIVENLFALSGIGYLIMQGIRFRDYITVLGCLTAFILLFAFMSFAVDIAKAFADPQFKELKDYVKIYF